MGRGQVPIMIPVVQPLPSQRKDLVVAGLQTTGIDTESSQLEQCST